MFSANAVVDCLLGPLLYHIRCPDNSFHFWLFSLMSCLSVKSGATPHDITWVSSCSKSSSVARTEQQYRLSGFQQAASGLSSVLCAVSLHLRTLSAPDYISCTVIPQIMVQSSDQVLIPPSMSRLADRRKGVHIDTLVVRTAFPP